MASVKSKNKIKPFTAGVVDIGAHSVRLDIFERSRSGSVTLLESLSRSMNLGRDVFRKGVVGPENLNLLCRTLTDFRRKLDEYKINNRHIIATSAIRESRNRELVVSRMHGVSGMPVSVLEEQAEARLYFLSMRDEISRKRDFSAMRGIGCILGTGSMIVIYFADGVMKFCESIAFGTMRLYDEFGSVGSLSQQISELLNTFDISQRLRESVGLTGDDPVSIIGMGAPFRLFVRFSDRMDENEEVARIGGAKMVRAAAAAEAVRVDELAAKFKLTEEQAIGVPMCGALLSYFEKNFNCREFIAPAATTRSAYYSDLLRESSGVEKDPFYDDVVAAARCLGAKYGSADIHAESVRGDALKIFDKLKMHFDFPPRARLLLEVSSLLHDVGRFVDARQHHKHSYYIIAHSQLPGISEAERRVVAAVARYHRKSVPRDSHFEYAVLTPEERVCVLKLAGILRVADALNRLHGSEFGISALRIRKGDFVIESDRDDIEFEKFYVKLKGELFTEVFGLETVLEHGRGKI